MAYKIESRIYHRTLTFQNWKTITCEYHAHEGARVLVSDVDQAGSQETVARIRDAGGEAIFVRADVSDPGKCKSMVDTTLEEYGRLGTPEEVAELVIWLSSSKASFVTGAHYQVDSGYLAR